MKGTKVITQVRLIETIKNERKKKKIKGRGRGLNGHQRGGSCRAPIAWDFRWTWVFLEKGFEREREKKQLGDQYYYNNVTIIF